MDDKITLRLSIKELAHLLNQAHQKGQSDARTRLLSYVQHSGEPIGRRSMKELCATDYMFNTAMPVSEQLTDVKQLVIDGVSASVGEQIQEAVNQVSN